MKQSKFYLFSLCIATCVLFTHSCKEEDITKTIIENKDTTSFEQDIKPIILTKCDPCHSGKGYQTAYYIYDNAKSSADAIITRINLNNGHSNFMPKDGNKLSQPDIDLFTKWKEDGLSKN
mgnify:CR=1 FL=1